MLAVFLVAVFAGVALCAYALLSMAFSDDRRVNKRLNDLTAYEIAQSKEAQPLLKSFSERVIVPSAGAVGNATKAILPTTYRDRLVERLDQAGHPFDLAAVHAGVLQAQWGKLLRGRGCSHCNGTGYRGRMGVYEMLEMTQQLVDAAAHHDSTHFMQAARTHMLGRTLIDQGIEAFKNRIGLFDVDDDRISIERFTQSKSFHLAMNQDNPAFHPDFRIMGESLFDRGRFIGQPWDGLTTPEIAPGTLQLETF